jgi:hypothetical protein
MRQYSVIALKDESRILGLILSKGAKISIDVEDERQPVLQAAVDSGDIAILGMSPAPAPSEKKGK